MSATLRGRLARLEQRGQVGWIDTPCEVHLYHYKVSIPGAPAPDDGEEILVAVSVVSGLFDVDRP